MAAAEAQEILLNEPLCQVDTRHSDLEQRYVALGRTNEGRRLFVAFTVRRKLIRPISFRDMTAKEKRVYEHLAKKGPEVH